MSLNTAFAELRRKHKFAARQRFKCCQGCGLSALAEEISTATAKRPDSYVFFHQQDAKRWDDQGHMHLAYGAFEHTKVTAEAVGTVVAEVLTRHGCPVDWNGDARTRLLVWRDENTRRERAAKLLGRRVA